MCIGTLKLEELLPLVQEKEKRHGNEVNAITCRAWLGLCIGYGLPAGWIVDVKATLYSLRRELDLDETLTEEQIMMYLDATITEEICHTCGVTHSRKKYNSWQLFFGKLSKEVYS